MTTKQHKGWSITLWLTIIFLLVLNRQCNAQQRTAYQIDSIINCVLIEHQLSPTTRMLIISQARVETGEYTSDLFLKHKNLFAMRHPAKRPTKSRSAQGFAEGRTGYATYASIEDSVEDLVLYLKYFKEFRDYYTVREYVVTLKLRGYFTAPKEMYISSMQHQNSRQIKKPRTNGAFILD